MTRLQAPDAARIALEWRKLSERAAVVRGRVEALPKAYQDGPMRAAENRISLRQMSKARELLDAIDEALDKHQKDRMEADMAAAGEEQNRLLAERGIETFDAGAVKARDGWVWLITRSPARFSAEDIEHGHAYRRLYNLATQDSLSTSSNDNGGSGEGCRIDAGMKNRSRLDAVQRHITTATGSTRLIALLDAVCGRGDTLLRIAKDDDRRATALEAELRIGLAMAGVGLKLRMEEEKRNAA